MMARVIPSTGNHFSGQPGWECQRHLSTFLPMCLHYVSDAGLACSVPSRRLFASLYGRCARCEAAFGVATPSSFKLFELCTRHDELLHDRSVQLISYDTTQVVVLLSIQPMFGRRVMRSVLRVYFSLPSSA